jgi:phenylglyoxylate dehydrogenase alpha subunit
VQAIDQGAERPQGVGVVDRSVSFGWNCGPLYQDVIGALQFAGKKRPAAMSFIGGLAGADITTDHFGRVIERVKRCWAARIGETVWLNEKD